MIKRKCSLFYVLSVLFLLIYLFHVRYAMYILYVLEHSTWVYYHRCFYYFAGSFLFFFIPSILKVQHGGVFVLLYHCCAVLYCCYVEYTFIHDIVGAQKGGDMVF